MILFAEVTLVRDGILIWATVGLLAGFFAGVVMKPGRYSVLGDTAAALAGAVLGGALFALLVGGAVGFVGSIAAAGLSACALIAALRAAAPTVP
jgi:uncharacterized membrane protein YeaQ/YmgE (transglycosylase-associated protein family)